METGLMSSHRTTPVRGRPDQGHGQYPVARPAGDVDAALDAEFLAQPGRGVGDQY